MFPGHNKHFLLGLCKVTSRNVNLTNRISYNRQACILSIILNAHASSVHDSTINATCSKTRLYHTCAFRHKYKTHCSLHVKSHLRGFVTTSPEAELDKDFITTKDKNEARPFVRNGKSTDAFTVSNDGQGISSSGKHKMHIPVMVEEVLQALQPQNGQLIVDMTFGAGGHAQEILKAAPGVHYVASDRDPLANRIAKEWATEGSRGQIIPILSRFSEIPKHLHKNGIEPGTVDAFLFDLGVSSMQFDFPERGFSLSKDGPLDMRMDGDRFPGSPTAADVINSLSPQDLAHILKKYGEEKKALSIAHAIVEAKYAFGNITRTRQLADVVLSVFNSSAFRQDKLSHHAHVATKVFQALRIFVNNELNEIHNGLLVARHYLKPQARCAVISFHSLEDRIVKRHFLDIDIDEAANLSIHDHFRNADYSFDVKTVQEKYMSKLWDPLSRKVREPSEEECYRNPRARSAKFRASLKV